MVLLLSTGILKFAVCFSTWFVMCLLLWIKMIIIILRSASCHCEYIARALNKSRRLINYKIKNECEVSQISLLICSSQVTHSYLQNYVNASNSLSPAKKWVYYYNFRESITTIFGSYPTMGSFFRVIKRFLFSSNSH